MDKPRYIITEGPIGAAKTSLAKRGGDFGELVKVIKKMKKGTQYFSPMGTGE